jgi:hypothetical protein
MTAPNCQDAFAKWGRCPACHPGPSFSSAPPRTSPPTRRARRQPYFLVTENQIILERRARGWPDLAAALGREIGQKSMAMPLADRHHVHGSLRELVGRTTPGRRLGGPGIWMCSSKRMRMAPMMQTGEWRFTLRVSRAVR